MLLTASASLIHNKTAETLTSCVLCRLLTHLERSRKNRISFRSKRNGNLFEILSQSQHIFLT